MNMLELTCMLEGNRVILAFNPKVLPRDQFFKVDVETK